MGEYVGRFVGRDALVGVDYAPRLHEHALCTGNSLWKERRVEPNSNASADKVAIVTAAGSGMGAACARELAGRGYTVALMPPSGKAEALAKELRSMASIARVPSLVQRSCSRWMGSERMRRPVA
jgi:hypothetical protein